jgi:hypothetical protein
VDKARQEEIIRVLKAKGVEKPCPRCGNEKFEIIGETGVQLQEDPKPLKWTIMGPVVPVILIACTKCGYLTQHAQGPLGLSRQSQ